MVEVLLQASDQLLPAAIWIATVLCLVSAVRRLVPVLLPGAIDDADAIVRRLLLAAVLVAGTLAGLGFAGWLRASSVGLAMVAIWWASRIVPPPADASRVGRPRWQPRSPESWPWLATALWLGFESAAALPTAPISWDAMTYHLYFPARWVQEGRIFHIPAVFADNAAGYAPQNGPLLYAWILSLSESDALCNVLHVLAVWVVVLSVYRIVRTVAPAAGPTAAAWSGFLAGFLPPVRRWAYTAHVDVLMLAAWLAAVSWAVVLVGGDKSEGPRRGTMWAAALAAGFCAGTKTVGLVLAVPVAVFAVLAWAAARVRSGKSLGRVGREPRVGSEPWHQRLWPTVLAGMAVAFLLFVAAGGWWYLRNLWLYGNPLFPLDVSVLGLHFDGAYSSAAMKTSYFSVSLGDWASLVWDRFGPVACALVVLGWLRLAAVRGLAARSLALFVPAWFLFEFAVMPYNSQVRFLLPACAVACCGLALLLGKLSMQWQAVLSLGTASLLVLTAAPGTGPYDELRIVARVATAGWSDYLASLAVGVLVLWLVARFGVWNRREGVRRAVIAIVMAVVAVIPVALASELVRASRGALLEAVGYVPSVAFEYEGLPALDIAYSGFNMPYVLMGPGFRHRVIYVNTRGEMDDGFYEHWRRDPGFYATNRPGIYRGFDDERVWLRRVDELGIDAVVVRRLFDNDSFWGLEWPEERGAFPQEREWMRRHPERFRLLGAGELWEIYLLDPEPSETPASE